MSDDKQEPSRQELFKAGKVENRRRDRRPEILTPTHNAPEEAIEEMKLRPGIIAIAIMAAILIILAIVGM